MKMAKGTVVLLLVVLALSLAPKMRPQPQEHAPTVDICRADEAVWNNLGERTDFMEQETKRIRGGTTKNMNPIAELTVHEINLRTSEMADCVHVDPPNMEGYSDLLGFYSEVVEQRYEDFIERHHLMKQFMAEDKAGAR